MEDILDDEDRHGEIFKNNSEKAEVLNEVRRICQEIEMIEISDEDDDVDDDLKSNLPTLLKVNNKFKTLNDKVKKKEEALNNITKIQAQILTMDIDDFDDDFLAQADSIIHDIDKCPDNIETEAMKDMKDGQTVANPATDDVIATIRDKLKSAKLAKARMKIKAERAFSKAAETAAVAREVGKEILNKADLVKNEIIINNLIEDCKNETTLKDLNNLENNLISIRKTQPEFVNTNAYKKGVEVIESATCSILEKELRNHCLDTLRKAVENSKGKIILFNELSDSDDLEKLLQKCAKLEKHLEEVDKLKELINSLNREKVAEIVSYSKPSQITIDVLKSVLYLLGEKKKTCKDWKKIRALIGKTGKDSIQRRISEFKNADHIDPKAKLKIQENLAELDVEAVEDISKVLAIFYAWAKCNVEFVL